MAAKTYTLEIVKQHNKPEDLWIIIEGKVYDVTKFRNEHPGGEDTLDEVGGRDATRDFQDVGHSQEAKQMLKKYYIGDLEVDKTCKLPVRLNKAYLILILQKVKRKMRNNSGNKYIA
ncbi:PREDICTED: cytochrome b5 isoform X1 [Bactrocera latifrons]|uniref:Cytochrome b5 n=1 Tax=Bactrocera latifrons TaxID=174628 RepID=A0A0K8UTP4_BACLA|nr:PREDICTED: cytochrome b5 isoform X1 [Bactrocera latifrons]